MFRSLIVLAVLAGTAHAREPRTCHVFNSTDHEIGTTGLYPGQSRWILPGTFKTMDGTQLLSIECDAKTPVLNLVGSRGSVTKTSKLVASTTLKGGEPGACRDSASIRIVGERVPKADLLAWLKSST